MTTLLPPPAAQTTATSGAQQLDLPLPAGRGSRPVTGQPAGHQRRISQRRPAPRRAPPRRPPGRAQARRPTAVLGIVEPGRRAPRPTVVRRALLASGAPRRCASCAAPPIWLGEPLPLEIQHINGDERDNRRQNLRFLCPNCHAQATAGARRRASARQACGAQPRGQPRWQQQELFDLAA